jgi:hypothetical protein
VSSAPRSVLELLGVTAEQWAAAPRAGARAGRGFHFQDAALTLLVVRGLLGAAPIGQLIPEGRDDATLDLAGSKCDAQVKSRQADQPDFREAEIAKVALDLADRRRADRLLIVLERGFPTTGLDRCVADVAEVRARLAPALVRRMDEAHADEILARLSILVTADPLAEAATELANTRGLHPAVARLAVQSLYAAVVACADCNAVQNGAPATVTVTDAAAIVDRTVELVDVAALDAALVRGLCEAVDFSEAIRVDGYLRGTATTPAHVAAGLVIDRPDAVATVTAELLARRRVLVTGPSGSGKSALLWLTVHGTRHAIRWYRIRRLDEADAVAVVDRLARALGATMDRPVGFVVDDGGRLGAARWDALVAEVAHRSGVVVLGAIREEGLTDLTTLTDVTLLRPGVDEAFAEAMWRTLREHGETTWAGWREPFEKAEGLILEYVNVLTSGARLDELLSDQVERLAAAHGDDLMAVLAFVTVADQLGIAVTLEQLAALTDLARTEIVSAVRRLENEFLVRADGLAVGGLHELRSAVTSDHALRLGFRALKAAAAAVIGIVDVQDLEVVVPRAARLVDEGAVVSALADRLTADPDVSVLAASLEGLRGIELHMSAAEVAKTLQEALAPGDVLGVVQQGFGAPIHDSVRILLNAPAIPSPPDALRKQLVASAGSAPAGVQEAGSLAGLIAALPAGSTPAWTTQAITDGVVVGHLGELAALLDAARGHGEAIHRAVVDAFGGPVAVACATAALRGFDVEAFDATSSSPTVRVLGADDGPFWRQPYASGRIVAEVMACSAALEDVKTEVVDATGDLQPPLTGRPSIDTPTTAEASVTMRGAERYRAAILAAVGSPQWTARLQEEQRLLEPLVVALQSYLECICHGRPDSSVRRRFGRLEAEAAQLAPPPAAIGRFDRTGSKERVGARQEADPFAALLRGPGWYMLDENRDASHAAVVAYRLWRVAGDLRDEHRWGLLPQSTDEMADRLVSTLADLRLVLAERAAMSGATWSAMLAGARLRPGHVTTIVDRTRREAALRMRGDARALERALRESGLAGQVEVVEDEVAPGAVWPPARLVVTISLTTARSWTNAVDAVMSARLRYVSGERSVTVLFELAGAVSGRLSGEAARAWWPRADVLAAAGVVGRAEPRGSAWRLAVRAAARMRASRAWRAQMADVTSPLDGLLETAFEGAEKEARAARAALLSMGLHDAVTAFDELCEAGRSEGVRERVTAITMAIADADASDRGPQYELAA